MRCNANEMSRQLGQRVAKMDVFVWGAPKLSAPLLRAPLEARKWPPPPPPEPTHPPKLPRQQQQLAKHYHRRDYRSLSRSPKQPFPCRQCFAGPGQRAKHGSVGPTRPRSASLPPELARTELGAQISASDSDGAAHTHTSFLLIQCLQQRKCH